MESFELTAEQEGRLKQRIVLQAQQAELLRTFRRELGRCKHHMKLELEMQSERAIQHQLLNYSYREANDGPPCSSSSAVEPRSSDSDSPGGASHPEIMDKGYYCNPISHQRG